ncbi:hypothetical protein ACVWXO_009210 [Bradyrhizobium sp. LM2.7]
MIRSEGIAAFPAAEANATPITGTTPQIRVEGNLTMSSKQPKLYTPTSKDLRDNPLIGGSKGANMAGASPDDVEDALGENTIEGDSENDVNFAGGIDKDVAHSGAPRRGRRP